MTGSITIKSEILTVVFGFVCVFVGDFLFTRFKKVKAAPPSARFILATAFTYFAAVAKEIVFFFTDYFSGSALQGYDKVPDKGMLFFRLFGFGAGNEYQYPLFSLDIGFIDMMLGCALGGVILFAALTVSERKRKKKNG